MSVKESVVLPGNEFICKMPALRLVGRRWLFASDDLVFPCLIEIPYRIVWMVLLGLVSQDAYLLNSGYASPARLHVVFTLLLQILLLLFLAIIAQQSARGSITDVEKRKYVGPLLLFKLFLMLVEIGLNIMGLLWIFFDVIHCPLLRFASVTMQSMMIITWIPISLTLLSIYLAYDPLGNIEYENIRTPEEREYYNRKSVEIWASRLQWTFWYFKDKKLKDAVDEMAALFNTLFRSTDLVLYDLIAGSILLRVRQKRETRDKRARDVVDSIEDTYSTDLNLVFRGTPSWMNIEEAHHYMTLSTAAYGWMYVLYRFYCTGLCFLMPYLRCCCWRPPNVIGDNCCMCNYAGLKHLSEVEDKDFIYVTFENHIYEVPFYVLGEHERKRIVVTVRGSNSLHDMFTDLAGAPEKFQAHGLPENTLAHKGMLLCTERTLERLAPILDEAFDQYPDYELVITGHSLGAAVSTLLGIKLIPKYPHLKVFAFSAPSGLLTREAARYTESFVMTVGVGDDLVMRISLKAAQTFRNRLIETIHMTRLPKYRILLKGLKYMIFRIPDSDLDSIWKTPDDIEAHLVGPARLARSISYDIERLYVAGRILHIARHKPLAVERSSRKYEPKYKMRWANPEDFTELVVMPGMLTDHLPQSVLSSIKKIIDDRPSSTPS